MTVAQIIQFVDDWREAKGINTPGPLTADQLELFARDLQAQIATLSFVPENKGRSVRRLLGIYRPASRMAGRAGHVCLRPAVPRPESGGELTDAALREFVGWPKGLPRFALEIEISCAGN